MLYCYHNCYNCYYCYDCYLLLPTATYCYLLLLLLLLLLLPLLPLLPPLPLQVFGASPSGVRRAFVMARPPGHHAEPDRAMGFCLYNNVRSYTLP